MAKHHLVAVCMILTLLVSACSASEPNASDNEPNETTAQTTAETSNATEATDDEPLEDSSSESGNESESDATQECGAVVSVRFFESAPRDRFTIANDSTLATELTTVTIDLDGSTGQIVFDTIEGGVGVEVFQDFQVEDGEAQLQSDPEASDGATSLVLEFSSFSPGQSFTFSIDVDDQLTDSDRGQIQVTGAEIAGALLSATTSDDQTLSGIFDTDASAVATDDC